MKEFAFFVILLFVLKIRAYQNRLRRCGSTSLTTENILKNPYKTKGRIYENN